MQLLSTAAVAFRGFSAQVRRSVIGYAICAVCGVAALVLVTWAAVLALLPAVGAVYAQLVVAGGFILVGIATVAWLQRAKSRAQTVMPFRPGDAPERPLRFAQFAMIVEAVLLGYQLSQRSDRR